MRTKTASRKAASRTRRPSVRGYAFVLSVPFCGYSLSGSHAVPTPSVSLNCSQFHLISPRFNFFPLIRTGKTAFRPRHGWALFGTIRQHLAPFGRTFAQKNFSHRRRLERALAEVYVDGDLILRADFDFSNDR